MTENWRRWMLHRDVYNDYIESVCVLASLLQTDRVWLNDG
jgi:hypothetical protein